MERGWKVVPLFLQLDQGKFSSADLHPVGASGERPQHDVCIDLLLSVHFQSSLYDQSPCLALARHKARLGNEIGKGDGAVGVEIGLGQCESYIRFAWEASILEPLLKALARLTCRLLTVIALNDEPGQSLLGFHRMRPFDVRKIFSGQQFIVPDHEIVADGHDFAKHVTRHILERHVIPEALAHFLDPISPLKQGHGDDDLGFLSIISLEITSHQEVELLVGSAQFDIAQVIDFDNRVDVRQVFTGSQPDLLTAIDRIAAGGSTSLHNAIYIALKELRKVRAVTEQDIRRQALVVFSDGEDTSSLVAFDEVLDLAKRSETSIYAIALRGADAQSKGFREAEFVMRTLAQETGGRAFFPAKIEDLETVYSQIADELASQYTMGYTSKNPRRDGAWRRIDVRVTRPNAAARAKRGYYAPTSR